MSVVNRAYGVASFRIPPIKLFKGTFVIGNRFHRLFRSDKRLQALGLRFSGIDEIAESKSLSEVCDVQWTKCIGAARRGFQVILLSQVSETKYEGFVQDPVDGLGRIFGFCGLEYEERPRSAIEQRVTTANIAKWQ